MDHHVITSGPMLLVYLKDVVITVLVVVTVPELTLLHVEFYHHLLLVIITTASLVIREGLQCPTYIMQTLFGMVNSVKVSVVAMENLHHGSVWS